MKPHNMSGRAVSWPYCKSCGLIGLKNPVSRKAESGDCPGPRDQKLAGAAADRLFAKLKKEGWS